MKTKIRSIFGIIGILFLSSILFTMSSKAEPDLFGEDNCDEQAEALINIIVPSFVNNGFLGRRTTFEDFIPQNDIRNDGSNPASSLTDRNKYYCVVTVTSPNCSKFNWSGRVTSTNGANGTMRIMVPSQVNIDTRIKVEYYEECGKFPWGAQGQRVKYIKEKTFFGSIAGFSGAEPFELFQQRLVGCSTGGGGASGGIGDILDEIYDIE